MRDWLTNFSWGK